MPYVWSLTSGAVPPGVILTADGSIAGIPTSPGNFEFSAKVADSQGTSDTKSFALTTKPASAVPRSRQQPRCRTESWGPSICRKSLRLEAAEIIPGWPAIRQCHQE